RTDAMNEPNRFLALLLGCLLMMAVILVSVTEAKADCPNGKCPIVAQWVDGDGKVLDVTPLDLPAPPLPREFCPTGKCPLTKVVDKATTKATQVTEKTVVRCRQVVQR